MFKHSKNRQRLISESDCAAIEATIASIEATAPLEVRVVVATKAGKYPLGTLRSVVLFMICLEVLCYVIWLPIPPWLFHVLLVTFLFTGAAEAFHFSFAWHLTSRRERALNIAGRAAAWFQSSDMSTTTLRNGVLLFVCPAEKQFYLLPDQGLTKLWPHDEWRAYAATLMRHLQSEKAEHALANGIVALLKKIGDEALRKLGPAKNDAAPRKNELSDAVVFLEN